MIKSFYGYFFIFLLSFISGVSCMQEGLSILDHYRRNPSYLFGNPIKRDLAKGFMLTLGSPIKVKDQFEIELSNLLQIGALKREGDSYFINEDNGVGENYLKIIYGFNALRAYWVEEEENILQGNGNKSLEKIIREARRDPPKALFGNPWKRLVAKAFMLDPDGYIKLEKNDDKYEYLKSALDYLIELGLLERDGNLYRISSNEKGEVYKKIIRSFNTIRTYIVEEEERILQNQYNN